MRDGDAVGMEGFQRVQLFAGAQEFDRRAGDAAHGKRRAAAGIAIDAGQDDARQMQPVVEVLGDIDRVLAGEAVGDQQGFVRIGGGLDAGHFRHQLLVDRLAAGGVENEDVIAADLGGGQGALGDGERILARDDGQAWRRRPARPARAAVPWRRDG